MRSVADDLRREQREKVRAMTPAERVALVRRLALRDLEFFVAAQKIARPEAIRRIRQSRQAGRRLSRCMER